MKDEKKSEPPWDLGRFDAEQKCPALAEFKKSKGRRGCGGIRCSDCWRFKNQDWT